MTSDKKATSKNKEHKRKRLRTKPGTLRTQREQTQMKREEKTQT